MDRLKRIADKSVTESEGLKESSDKAMEQIQDAFATLQQVSAAAVQIKEISSQLSTDSNDSLETVSDVRKSLANTSQMVTELKEYNQSVSKKIAELSHQASTIEDMNSIIKEIIKKTTMLSLNASIEAARAGEHGKGFSVVAQEIKSLSDQSRDAVNQSSQLLSAIEESVCEVVESVENEKRAVEKGIDEIEKMSAQMEGIYQKKKGVHQQVEQTENASINQSAMSQNAAAKLELVVKTVQLTLDFVT
ncbi:MULTISPECIES: methyl-accepting chemotaxis protein [Bacillus]